MKRIICSDWLPERVRWTQVLRLRDYHEEVVMSRARESTTSSFREQNTCCDKVQKVHNVSQKYCEGLDVLCLTVPTNISNLFIKANEKHIHETRFSSSFNFYINRSRLNKNHGSFARFGAKFWNSTCDELRHLPKRAFEKHINDVLFSLLEAEDDYVESPILLQKIYDYQANIEFNL